MCSYSDFTEHAMLWKKDFYSWDTVTFSKPIKFSEVELSIKN